MAVANAELRRLREKQQNQVVLSRAEMAKITEATPEADARTYEAAADAFMAEYDRLQVSIDREEKLAEAEARAEQRDPNRPLGDNRSEEVEGPKTEAEKQQAAFRSYMRFGREGMSEDEKRALGSQRKLDPNEREARAAQGVGDATAGGFLVPEGFMSELIVAMKAFGPMLDPGVTREIVTTSGNQIPWPGLDDTANQGRRLGENQPVVETTLSFASHNLFAYKYTTDVVKVSAELLQDSGIDPESIIRDAMAVRMGRIVNSDLTNGNGASQPTGIAFAASVGATAGSSTAIAFDDMIELEHSLDPDYRKLPGVRWQFHDTTLKALRKLKDGDGVYIWQPASVIAKAPATILGYDYVINQAIAQIATGAKSVIFGDHSRYVVRRVREFLVRRLNERYADNDQVGFIGFARFDGALIDQKAIEGLQHP